MESNTTDGIISFIGSDEGGWRVLSMQTISGEPIGAVKMVKIVTDENETATGEGTNWTLRAFISNLRYTTKKEKHELNQGSRPLNQPEFTRAALIPIKKSADWWNLAQDERRKIFEEDSHHIQNSSKYLTVISRQLYHCKDLGEQFDFLTWFEFAPEHSSRFDELCSILRKTEEWKYVTRETDIRLERHLA